MSNLTHTAHREENGLRLMCEAFNEATLFAKSADVALDVQCKQRMGIRGGGGSSN